MSQRKAAEAIRLYDQLLKQHRSSTAEIIARGIKERQLYFTDRLRCDVLRPCFLDEATDVSVRTAAVAAVAALNSIHQQLIHNLSLLPTLGFPGWATALARVDAETVLPTVVGRIDGLRDRTGEIQFIEYNTNPGGIIETDELAEVFAATPCMQALGEQVPCTTLSTRAAMLETLLGHQRQLGRGEPPALALIGPVEPKNQLGVDKLLAFLSDNGIFTRSVLFDANWSNQGGGLFLDDRRIDAVIFAYPDTAVRFLLQNNLDHPIFKAVHESTAYIVNGFFRSAVLYSKTLFAAISDPEFPGIERTPEIAQAERWIPWTRLFRDGSTIYQGKRVRLEQLVTEHRDRFVLKPAFGFGGDGVTLGWEATAEQWAATLAQTQQRPYIVQERIEMIREPYPLLEGENLEFTERYSDLNPFVWGDVRAEGYMIRLSQTSLLNVSAGTGSMTPVFIVPER